MTNQYLLIIEEKLNDDTVCSNKKREDMLYVPSDEEAKLVAKRLAEADKNILTWELFKKIDGGAR